MCHNCEETLRDWTKGKQKGLPFDMPMVWCESKEYLTGCYFCLVNTKGIGKKNRLNISYPSILSAIRPVLHSDEFSLPVFNGFVFSEDEKLNLKKSTWKWSIKEQIQNLKTHVPKLKKQFNQLELND